MPKADRPVYTVYGANWLARQEFLRRLKELAPVVVSDYERDVLPHLEQARVKVAAAGGPLSYDQDLVCTDTGSSLSFEEAIQTWRKKYGFKGNRWHWVGIDGPLLWRRQMDPTGDVDPLAAPHLAFFSALDHEVFLRHARQHSGNLSPEHQRVLHEIDRGNGHQDVLTAGTVSVWRVVLPVRYIGPPEKGWIPTEESREAARVRLSGEFEKCLDFYLDEIEMLAKRSGFKRVRAKRAVKRRGDPWAQLDWVIHRRCIPARDGTRKSWKKLGKLFGETAATVKDGVTRMEKILLRD
jgi:hypothetical protein